MEERVPLATTDYVNPNAHHNANGTYIIRIPKDQVYRVPPPENAEIVDRNRKNAKNDASKGQHGRCVCWVCTILLILGFLAAICFCVWRFTLNPQPPTFVASHVDVKMPPSSKKASLPPGFQITLVTENPNGVNDIKVDQGTATLKYRDKQISKGRYPSMKHDAGKTRTVEVVLVGSAKDGLPKELQEAMDPKRKSKKSVNLKLDMELPVEMITWIYTKVKRLKYECDLELSSLGENAKLLSDRCRVL